MSLEAAQLHTILKQVGKNCSILANGVAKLYLASPDPTALNFVNPDSILAQYPEVNNRAWTDAEVVGALVLVKDKVNRTITFQIYSLNQEDLLLFEYELYEDLQFDRLSDIFYCFEMDECMAGLAFVETEVAQRFFFAVKSNTPKSPPIKIRQQSKVSVAKSVNERKPSKVAVGKGKSKKERQKQKKKKDRFFKKKKKAGLNLDHIGDVEEVQHMTHIGVNDSGQFDLKNLPAEWKQFFKAAGIKKSDLKDPVIAQEMIKTIQTAEMNMVYGEEIKSNVNTNAQKKQEYTPQQRLAFEEYQEDMMKHNQNLTGRREATSFRNMEINDDVRTALSSPVPVPTRRLNNRPPQRPPRQTNISQRQNSAPHADFSDKKDLQTFEDLMSPTHLASNRNLNQLKVSSKKKKKNSGFKFLEEETVKPQMKQQNAKKVVGVTVVHYEGLETYEERPEPEPIVVEKIVEVVRHEKSEELQRMEQMMKKMQAEADAARQRAEELEEQQRQFMRANALRQEEYDRKMMLKEQELEETKKLAEDLALAKEKEEQEKIALKKANEEAAEARKVLELEKQLTEQERQEALRKVAETEAVVLLAESNLNETKLKLEESNKIKLEVEMQRQHDTEEKNKKLMEQQQQLLDLKKRADDLEIAKAKEEAEKIYLSKAMLEAEDANKKLADEHKLTRAQREEALKKVEATNEAVQKAQDSLEATALKLKLAEERAKKIPKPPPSLKKIPKLPPLSRTNAPKPPPLPPLPPLPPPEPEVKPEVKIVAPPKTKPKARGPLNMDILKGIKSGVPLVPVQKPKLKTKNQTMGLIAQLQQAQRAKAKRVLRPQNNRQSVMKALSTKMNRLSVNVLHNKKKANALVSNLQAQIMLRRANMEGKILTDDSDSEWSD